MRARTINNALARNLQARGIFDGTWDAEGNLIDVVYLSGQARGTSSASGTLTVGLGNAAAPAAD